MQLVHTLKEDKSISALTTLNKELFVRYGGNSSGITVYDTETYAVRRSLSVPRLGSITDMTSCKRNQCIYISDLGNNAVHRVDTKNTITQWSVGDVPESLSVNSAYNVLVTCDVAGKIKEFTTDGKLIRVISLQSDFIRPLHVVEMTTDRYIVCLGNEIDPLQRVCMVDTSGRVLQSFGGYRGSGKKQLNGPSRLAVIHGLILVADRSNHRVLMLSPSLNYVSELVSGLRHASRLWFDEDTGRLYIADNKYENKDWVSGHVTVYSV